MEIDKDKMQELCDDAEIDVRWDYSGRGMYGKSCFGIVGDTRDVSRFLIEVLRDFYPDIADIPAEWYENSRDSMGLYTIFYWPGITAAPEPTPEDAHPADVKYDQSDRN